MLNEKLFEESFSRIGLFWFSNDYKEIIRIEGVQEIDNKSLSTLKRVDPIGLHAEYDMPRDAPRGRVYYEDQAFSIWIGEDCPLKDEEIIKIVRKGFELKIDVSKFRVRRHYLFDGDRPTGINIP